MANEYLSLVEGDVAAPTRNPYLDIIQSDNQAKETQFRASTSLAIGNDPDRMATEKKVAGYLGTVPAVVQTLPQDAERAAKLKQIDDNTANSPVLRLKYGDVAFANLAHDDSSALSSIESLFGALKNSGKALASGVPKFNEGMWGVGQAAFETIAPIMDPLAGTILPENPLRRVAAGMSQMRGVAKAQGDALIPKADGIMSGGWYSGLQSFTQNMLTLPAAVLTGNPTVALAPMVASTGGQAYGEARDKGVEQIPALTYGLSQAAIEYATEKLPMGMLLKDLKVGSSVYKTLAHQVASEIPGEQLATVLQDMNEWAVLHPEKPFTSYLEDRPSAAAQTLIATMVGVGGNVAVGKVAERMLGTEADHEKRTQDAEAQRMMLDQLNSLAEQSKLKARDQETFLQFVEATTDGTPAQDLYIAANTLMQSGVAEQAAQVLPSVREQLPDALASNGYVRIPTAEYAAMVSGTELNQSLIDHVKTDPNGYTFAESKEYQGSFNQEMQTQMERLLVDKQGDEAFKASRDQVRDEFLTQLNQAKRFTEDVNNAYATMLANFYAVTAAKLGVTPQALVDRYKLRAQAEAATGAEQYDQAGQLKTDTPEFRTWFDGSQVVNNEGQPLVVYHGTDKAFTAFDSNKTMDGVFWFTSDKSKLAKGEAGAAAAGEVMPVYLSAKKLAGWSEYDRFSIDELMAQGYDAIKLDDDYVIFNPTQIKSVDNRGTFNPNDPNILNQAASQRDLMVTHNLSAENLLHAAKIGGIPVPSLAITHKDRPLNGFGEITLIGDEKMADPKGYASTKVFGADIYSPRYPRVSLEFTANMRKRGEAQLKAGMEATDSNYIEWSEVEREGARELERTSAFLWKFLTDRGLVPDVKRVQVEPLPTELAQFAESGKDRFDLMQDEAFIATAWKMRRDQLVLLNEGNEVEADAELAAEKARVQERGRFHFASSLADKITAYHRDLRNDGKIDREATRYALEKQVRDNNLSSELETAAKAFIEDLNPNERIFQGFTNSGNRKYIPHTLDNVVKILKKELRGGEGFNYGVGSLRAKFTPQFKSIAQIRKEKGRLVDKASFEKVKKEIDDDLMALSNDLGFTLEQTIGMLEDAPKMGLQRAAQVYQNDIELSDDTKQAAVEFLERLRHLPTEYFEAKILREVDLTEFSGAVVPEGVDQRVLDALAARGVKDIKFYKRGDEADRAAKIGEFDNLFFQGQRGQIAFGKDITQIPSIITLFKGADLSTFLHESGHFFLEVQMDMAARIEGEAAAFGDDTNSEGERQILADTYKLLEWFGVHSIQEWYGLSAEERRSYHEQFARGFESYAFEGNAPTLELQAIFQRFRAWLVNIYRELKNLNVELTDEVRGVMDRMLATTEQIQAAETARNMGPLFTPENAKDLIEDWKAYHDLANASTAEAIDELQAKALTDMQWMSNARTRILRQLQKQHDALRAEVMIESRREIMSQPVYRAWQFLTGKMSKEDKEAVTPDAPPKSVNGPVDESVDSLFTAIAKLGGLDRDQVRGQWGLFKDERSPMPLFGKPVVRKTDGMGIDAMAELLAQYGYLPLDEHGKHDLADFEAKFDAEYRGDTQYSVSHDFASAQGEQRAGEWADLENLGAGRFDLLALKDLGLPSEIVEHIVNLKMTAKDGIAPDLVAESFGFTSGDELVRTLAIAEDPKVAIKQLTDQKMLERHGDLATPEAIAAEADKAVHNEMRAKMLHAEARALEKAMGVQEATGKTNKKGQATSYAVLPKAARDFAERMVARLKVRDIRPAQYAAAEAKAAREAERAFGKGDIEGAAEQKRNQIINNYATRAAYNAQEEVRKAITYLRKFDKKSKGLDVDYYDQIVQMLERFDLVPSTSLKTIDRRTSLANWLKAQEEAGFVPEMSAELEAEAYRKSYKDMTVEELRGLRDTIKQIEHLGRLKQTLLTAKDQRDFDTVREEIVNSIIAHGKGRIAENRTPNTVLGEKLLSLKNFWASHIKAATWARIMDGGQDGGPVWEYLIRTANAAGDKEVGLREEATKELSALVAPVLAEGKMGGKGTFFPTVGRSFNKEARLAIALNVGNASNMQRLLGGEGWTLGQVKPILDTLTTADWRFVQSVWDYFESYRPEIGAKQRRVYGTEPAWIDPQPLVVQTSDGETLSLRGGYYPVKYDPRSSERAEAHMEAETAKRMMQGAYTSATTRRSFTKGRVEEVNGRPLLYSLDGIYNGVNEVIHDLSWHEWLIDANRLLKNPKIAEAMRDTYGAEVHNQFKSWVKDIAEGDRGAQNAGEKSLAWIRQGVSISGLGINVMSALLQPFGITQSMVRIGSKWVGKGIAKTIADPVGTNAEICEMSEFMRTRGLTRMRELAELRNQVKGQTQTRANIDAAAYALMLRAQQLVDIPTWWGAYEKATAEGNGEERAVAMADQAVIDAQGSGTTKDLAAIERGGPALKLFTVFYSFMNTSLNLGVGQTMTAESKAKLAADYLLIYVVPVVLIAMMKSAFTPGDSGDWDDPKKIALKLLKEEVGYLMGLFFGVRELQGIVDAFQGKPQGEYSGPAGTRLLSDTLKLAKQVGQGEMDDGLRKATINVAGELLRLPSAQINRSITGGKALAEGKTKNPAALLFGYEEPH